jgi:putative IMPACT (imprinted ancient) family translation regulator
MDGVGNGPIGFFREESRFLGEARPAKSAEEARRRIKELREEHPRARHVAWAYVLGGDAALKGMSDDGEPRGTAGRPILDLIAGED